MVLEHFGRTNEVRCKGRASDIFTAADMAAENLITTIIRQRHPEHNLLGEEGGFQFRGSEFTWVIDPLDGTSNFAAGLPWFGVMVAVLEQGRPRVAAMYLPVGEVLFYAERGRGVLRNGQPVRLPANLSLRETLCACGMDPGADAEALQRQARLMTLLVTHARNVRLTNCLLDFCHTLEGRFGACVNHHCKIWDIAPACLMFPEAGGCFTDLQGNEIRLDLDPAHYQRSYAVAGGSAALHPEILALARQAGF